MTYSVVWFKRDLRAYDHAPLMHAAHRGSLLCVYILEPEFWRQPDSSLQHYYFLYESLRDLSRQLRQAGAELRVAVGDVTQVLTQIHASAAFDTLVSHEETGNAFTFSRDKDVARWCREKSVAWREFPQHGVVRGLSTRKVWSQRWHQQMNAPCMAPPEPGSLNNFSLNWPKQVWPAAHQFGLSAYDPPYRQRGGRALGVDVLQDFLLERSSAYRGGISSPLTAPTACSRLSPYLAWGCLSMREVVQATNKRLLQIATQPGAEWHRKGLEAFTSRLHWHCHFIQKLESEPELEMHNLHRGYDDLRESEWNPEHFAALVAGRTGWPMVDACVAMLRETGWINFRMRAMLVSVASYPLWLHWRPVGLWLAQQFLDYEPGIHWSQMQMQAGTTGINTTRIYNPIKQAQDYDHQGKFVRRWLPALRQVPDNWLFQPWCMPSEVQKRCGVTVGLDIAIPLVDLEVATREAKAKIYAVRAKAEVREAKAAILEKHGSHQTQQMYEKCNPRQLRQKSDFGSQQQSFDF
ncbi:deoxyribodipyrimidine photo-lyase/cryptochrome family protein [Undibacterium sp. SXout7W]|uniref:cryptochrome/deoxyribodipyrimidine photo-lyase family protein n=1 Tax=Undibacterium sp. SXout7W TaxID=3413049 RepID=UPI003BF2DFC1